jgi:serine/threonine protein kinase
MNFVFNFTLLLFLSLFSFFVAQKCENLATFKDYLLEYANSKFNNQRFKHLHKILLDGNLKSEASILGKGKYGSVYSTHKLIDNKWEPVALKIMIINRESIGMFLTEVEILCSFVGNPFILQIIDFGIVNMNSLNTLAIVTEKATGDGHSLLKSERIGPQNRQEIAKSAIFAIESLHQAYFVHRDIKLENFLYFKKNEKITLKLADFGLASKSHMVRGRCGTPGYIAPEIELQKTKGGKYVILMGNHQIYLV